jgi:hypothetical protein
MHKNAKALAVLRVGGPGNPICRSLEVQKRVRSRRRRMDDAPYLQFSLDDNKTERNFGTNMFKESPGHLLMSLSLTVASALNPSLGNQAWL